MGRFTRELKEAGVLRASDRLEPSPEGRRIHYERKQQTVIDGPFTESKELVGSHWIWQVSGRSTTGGYGWRGPSAPHRLWPGCRDPGDARAPHGRHGAAWRPLPSTPALMMRAEARSSAPGW